MSARWDHGPNHRPPDFRFALSVSIAFWVLVGTLIYLWWPS